MTDEEKKKFYLDQFTIRANVYEELMPWVQENMPDRIDQIKSITSGLYEARAWIMIGFLDSESLNQNLEATKTAVDWISGMMTDEERNVVIEKANKKTKAWLESE